MGLSCFAALALLAVSPQWEPSREYRFEGRLTAEKMELGEDIKRFQLSLFTDAAASSGSPQATYWTLTENGRGQAPWPERFGVWMWDDKPAQRGPALFYQRGEEVSVVRLPPFALMHSEPLTLDKQWSEEGKRFQVTGETKVEDRSCWVVEGRDAVGRTRKMAVEKASRIIVLMEENLFLGQGERHQLQWVLRSDSIMKSEVIDDASRAAREMIAVREKVGRGAVQESADLTKEQREAFASVLPDLIPKVKGSPLEQIVAVANQDLRTQDRREDSVASIRQRAMGRKIDSVKLVDLRGAEASIQPGRVTVLHFWQYRDKPLKEPYGQVAYLDFLFRQRKKEGLAVYGIHVHPQGDEETSRQASARSAKRFCDFMNISYPVLVNGDLLEKIGDPQTSGASLPLYVVLDRQGKVVHYKTGYYEVDRQAGLKELDQVVAKALKAAKP